MHTNLPTELLRSFVAVIDTGSMIAAADSVHLTQSAISLQIKRLEVLLDVRLFNRGGRLLKLTNAGEELARVARRMLDLNDQAVSRFGLSGSRERIRIGCIQDFADVVLRTIFVDIFRSNLNLRAEVKVAMSFELIELFNEKLLDVVMIMGERSEGELVCNLPVCWYGEPYLFDQSILPVAVLDQPCGIRESMLEALEHARRPYRIVVETRSISALRAAVDSGVAVTARAGPFMGPQLLYTKGNAPDLMDTGYRLLYAPTMQKRARPVLDLIRQTMIQHSQLPLQLSAIPPARAPILSAVAR